MRGKATLKDVAREAGVHSSTASRALNEATREVVNAETVARVQAAAERLGYTPNPLAKGLRTNQTMTVAVIIPDVENPLFGSIIAGAESQFAGASYSTLIVDAGLDEGYIREVVASLIERRVDGVLLATSTREDGVVDDLSRQGIPTVLVNRMVEDGSVPSIVPDDHVGIGLAVRHLADLGHTVIGHLAGPRNLSTGLGRVKAYLEWMAKLGLEADEDLIEDAAWFQVGPGYEAASKLLDRRPDITAITAANDLIALGCYRVARERGLVVGEDLCIVGYNDIPLLDLLEPPLTSVRVPYREMGAEAARALLEVMADRTKMDRPFSIHLPPTLSVRGSTGARPA